MTLNAAVLSCKTTGKGSWYQNLLAIEKLVSKRTHMALQSH